jgi:hypothetical protein
VSLQNSGHMNALWKYEVASNQWNWMSGYSSNGQSRNASIPHYRAAAGFALDDSQSMAYIFGGQFPGGAANDGFIGKTFNIWLCRRTHIYHTANDLWRYDCVFNTWMCLVGDCNSNSSTVLARVTSDPASPGSMQFPRMAYLSNSSALALQGTNDNSVWFFDIIASKWYYVLAETTSANYSAMGVISSKNRPPTPAKLGKFMVVQSQLFLLQLGSEEKWSLTICDNTSTTWNTSTPCFSCAAGMYPDSNLFECVNCSAGTFSSAFGQSSCGVCPVGSFSNSSGSSSCSQCTSGRFASSSALSTCQQCAAGSFSNSSGMSVCSLCPSGRFTPISGQSFCQQCTAGYFTNTSGMTSCSANCTQLKRFWNQTDGKCYRYSTPTLAWTWVSGSSTANSTAMSDTSFGSGTDAAVVGSNTQPVGYLFGGWIAATGVISRRMYSMSKDFNTVQSLSSCSVNDYTLYGVETSVACPNPRLKGAIWLVQDSFLFVFGGLDWTSVM